MWCVVALVSAAGTMASSKPVHVTLRAKWNATSFLLEAGEFLVSSHDAEGAAPEAHLTPIFTSGRLTDLRHPFGA